MRDVCSKSHSVYNTGRRKVLQVGSEENANCRRVMCRKRVCIIPYTGPMGIGNGRFYRKTRLRAIILSYEINDMK